MEIYFKQSVGCVYKNLRNMDYKAYTYYDKGETLVADHPACTNSQINQGYSIEFVIVAILMALGFGFVERRETRKTNVFGIAAYAAVCTIITTLILNFVTMIFPIVATIGAILSVLAGCVWVTSRMENPLELWREYQAEKERLAQKRLREAQAEINRLRASDPTLNEALKSLDAMTTALHD